MALAQAHKEAAARLKAKSALTAHPHCSTILIQRMTTTLIQISSRTEVGRGATEEAHVAATAMDLVTG